jgi:multiple sugar transport system substrate-binding protein
MSRIRRRDARAAALTALALTASLAACSSDGGGGSGDGDGGAAGLKVWIQEDLPDRVAATQKIMDDFTKASGVEVDLVPVAEDQFNQLLTSSAAAGELPDVVGGVALPQVRTMSANQLLDTEATASVLEGLDEATFSESALELTRDGDTQLAIPSESWTQLLVYRKDLFDAAGLEAPTSYDAILAAAEALDSPDVAGFVGANIAGDSFTEQTFEHIALGNGCELVDDSGEVTLDSDECVEALEFYGQLQQNYSVSGGQDVDTTRASYFAGQAAMIIWSTFILDEMAALREDALPTCPECKKSPAFLAENSGVVTSIEGPSGSAPATFGEITSWVIAAESDTDPASQLVEYMLTDGYEPWLAIAPEGKVPVRGGDAAGSTNYTDAWAKMPVGVDSKAPLTDFYGPDVIEALSTGPEEIARWAIPQGQGNLLGAIQGERPVAEAVNQVSNGTDPAEAASQAADAVRSAQESVQ